jgi:hypothetical protein
MFRVNYFKTAGQRKGKCSLQIFLKQQHEGTKMFERDNQMYLEEMFTSNAHFKITLTAIRSSQGHQEGGGVKLPRAPTLIGPQLESESLKLSRFSACLKLRASYSTSTCSLA